MIFDSQKVGLAWWTLIEFIAFWNMKEYVLVTLSLGTISSSAFELYEHVWEYKVNVPKSFHKITIWEPFWLITNIYRVAYVHSRTVDLFVVDYSLFSNIYYSSSEFIRLHYKNDYVRGTASCLFQIELKFFMLLFHN